jgi:signal transduction histidine kinase
LTDHPTAALIAFFALGANLIATLLLLMMNARSRSVRGYVVFMAVVCVWLLAQAMTIVTDSALWFRIDMLAVAMLPGFFLAFALLDDAARPLWHALLVLALSVLLAPVVASAIGCVECSSLQTAVVWTVTIVGWVGGSALLWLSNRRNLSERYPAARTVRQRLILMALLIIVPLSVAAAIIADSAEFPLYVIPFLTVAIQILVFYGVTRMQFYHIDVRVRRSGDVAAETLETERLAVLGELAATLAHEVRNPLTGVRSLAQRIAQDDVPAEKRKRYGEVILEETGRVERLVDNLLELSRRGVRKEGSAQAIPLAPLLEDLALLTEGRAERAGVELRMNAHRLTVSASREVLLQALLNLVLNAIVHSPRGGRVNVNAASNGEHVDIVVSDQGTGVPAADRERIFDPFYSTTERGTGLGLSVVRHLVREHGWRIEVGEAPGGGAQFTLGV